MSQINFDTWKNAAQSKTYYGAQGWINWNGTGVVAIRASKNVTSLTDNGTGDYSINWTVAMADANYAPVFGTVSGNATRGADGVNIDATNLPTTTVLRVLTYVGSSAAADGALTDLTMNTVAVFGN